jgi:protein arginine kinase
VRLARNVAGFPFQARLDTGRAAELADRLKLALLDARIDGETWWVPIDEAGPVLRLLLLERNLASSELTGGEAGATRPGQALAFGETETVSVMVNEEDHLRLQALAAGFDLDLACQRVQVLDRYLETQVEYAYTERLGYLTGCPTNVGTGLRASVMLHLPALGLARKELEKVFTAAQHIGLAVRGMHGEGSRAAGDLYQISNQVTLGRSEERLVGDLKSIVPAIVDYERSMRRSLLEERAAALQDRITRSYGTLRTARAMPTERALAHLSNMRLGVHAGLLPQLKLETLNHLGIQVQKGHIHALTQQAGHELELLDATERDKLRASFLRTALAGPGSA